MEASTQKRIRELEDKIIKYDYEYFVLNAPTVSDYEYDRDKRELAQLHPESPRLTSIQPSPQGFVTINYVNEGYSAMLSLDKAYSQEEVEKVLDNHEYVALYKIDGLACSATFEDGKLVESHTRGNGKVGDVITDNFSFVSDAVPIFPDKIKNLPRFEVRGEVYMKKSAFVELNAEKEKNGEQLFTSARNAASGSLKQKNPYETAKRKLSFFAYDLLIDGKKIPTETELLSILEFMGFKTPWIKTKKDLKEYISAVTEERSKLDFDIDGIVFAINSKEEQKKLGYTSHHPKFKIAYKFQSENGTTTLLSKEWVISRTGRLKPVGIIEPIELAGAKCARVTLHNAKFIVDNRIEDGEEIVIERSGDVIPHFLSMVSDLDSNKRGDVILPDTCPSCGVALYKNFTDNVDLICPHKTCPGRERSYLKFYVSKPVVNLDTVGTKVIDQLYDAGLVRIPADLYSLTEDDLMKLDRMGKRKAEKILEAIKIARKQDKEMFLRSLGIDGLGKTVSRLIVDKIDWSTNILRTTAPLDHIEGIGPIIAKNIEEGLENKAGLIAELLSYINIEEEEEVEELDQIFNGESFCVTGKVIFEYNEKQYEDRAEIQKLIMALGGKTSSSVSSKLNYLLAGEKAGGKLTKAISAGVKVISSKEFETMIKGD